MTTLRCHPHLSGDVVLVSGMNEAGWKERRRRDCRNIVDRHLVKALQVDDEFEEVQEFAHGVAVFMWQQKAQHRDGPDLILRWESCLKEVNH